MLIRDIRELLKTTKPNETGNVELINVSFFADEDYILRKPNKEYILRELEWYNSQSRYVQDIPGQTPKIWKQISAQINSPTPGLINSNYGWCIYNPDNYYQYQSCLLQLKNDKHTRKAIMIYTRPSIQIDHNFNGMSDFICTNNVQVFIRENQLIYIVNQRSCDAVFGFNNDLAWHKHVYDNLLKDVQTVYPEVGSTMIEYICGSLHVYPRHFNLLEK